MRFAQRRILAMRRNRAASKNPNEIAGLGSMLCDVSDAIVPECGMAF